jgi:exopolyphosphatase/pppGpp-phosphohydrolase
MEEMQSAHVCAAIDVGSNTIHIVVARCFPSTLEILADEQEIVRIGENVTATGAISPEKYSTSIRVLQEYRALAESQGAERIFVVATEAIRQASNSADFIKRVREETGLEMRLISGMAEATLTFFGSTYEAGNPEQVGVMDLGGGSLELVFARNMQITWHTSVPIGSGWLHDRYLTGDPPTSDEINEAEIFLEKYFQHMTLKQRVPQLIVTGGSANSLLFLVQKAFHHPDEPRQLSRADLARCQGLLSALEAGDIVTLYGQPMARAKILLAGTLIIRHIIEQFQLPEILVSSHGIREGVLLAYARYGERWLEEACREVQPEESFAQSAHKILLERLHALLEWPVEVLKHEDIEAVHKMRVATRRLRAALDAYQSCCDPALFARVYRKVKKVADMLGEARDADVQLHYLGEQLADLSANEQKGVRWLILRLQTHRQQRQRKLDVFLRKLDGKKLEQQLKKSLRERMSD